MVMLLMCSGHERLLVIRYLMHLVVCGSVILTICLLIQIKCLSILIKLLCLKLS